jgi:hypothetical protein
MTFLFLHFNKIVLKIQKQFKKKLEVKNSFNQMSNFNQKFNFNSYSIVTWLRTPKSRVYYGKVR